MVSCAVFLWVDKKQKRSYVKKIQLLSVIPMQKIGIEMVVISLLCYFLANDLSSPESPSDSNSPIILYMALILIDVASLMQPVESAFRNVAISYSVLSEISSYFTNLLRNTSNFSASVSLIAHFAQPRRLVWGIKKADTSLYLLCGERGIRTPGSSHFNGFQDRRNRPLCHLSRRPFIIADIRCCRLTSAKVELFFILRKFFATFLMFFLNKIFFKNISC